VIGAGLGLVAAGGALTWIGYAWAPHLLTARCVWRAPRHAGRRIALTFDDGPDPDFTPRVLDLLAARGVRATFFLVGERAARAPATVRAIAAAGPEIA
jgi:peptidoglycan/xylan/chitin deacetylase (PgdA/CDA1 family)